MMIVVLLVLWALVTVSPGPADAQTLVTRCQTEFGGAATTDAQECVARYAEVFFAENLEVSRTTACMFTGGGCPAKFKSSGRFDPSPGTAKRLSAAAANDGALGIEETINGCTGAPSGSDCGSGWGDMYPEPTNVERRTIFIRHYTKYRSDWVQPSRQKHWENISLSGGPSVHSPLIHEGSLPWEIATQGAAAQDYGQNVGTTYTPIQANRWYCVETQITMNTGAATADGTLRMWVDDDLKVDRPNIIVAAEGPHLGTSMYRLTMSGWGNFSPLNTPASLRYVDRIVIATARIGCVAGAGGGTLNAPANLLLCTGAGCTPALVVPLGALAGLLVWVRRRLKRSA